MMEDGEAGEITQAVIRETRIRRITGLDAGGCFLLWQTISLDSTRNAWTVR